MGPEDETFDSGFETNGPDWMDEEKETHIGRTVMDGSWAKDLSRIQQWEQELKDEKANLRDLVAFLRNLNCLKSVLKDRRAERSELIADVLFADIRF